MVFTYQSGSTTGKPHTGSEQGGSGKRLSQVPSSSKVAFFDKFDRRFVNTNFMCIGNGAVIRSQEAGNSYDSVQIE